MIISQCLEVVVHSYLKLVLTLARQVRRQVKIEQVVGVYTLRQLSSMRHVRDDPAIVGCDSRIIQRQFLAVEAEREAILGAGCHYPYPQRYPLQLTVRSRCVQRIAEEDGYACRRPFLQRYGKMSSQRGVVWARTARG